MTKKKKKMIVFLSPILILGAFLRIWRLGEFSLWKDEIFSMLEAQHSLLEIFTSKTYSFGFTPIHHFFAHLALYFGKSEFIVRFPSVVFGMATIYLIFKLGKLFFGSKVGLMAALLLAISSLHLEYSREVRYYSYLIFFSGLTIFFLYKLVTEKRWRWLLLFFLMTILNIATQSVALLALLPQLVFLGICFWPSGFKSHLSKIKLGKLVFILPLLVVAGVFIKSFGELFAKVKFAPAMPFPQFLVQVLESLSGSKFLLALYLVFFLFGLLISFRKNKNQVILLLLLLILPPLVLYFFRPTGFGFHIRYVIFILIPYLLIISYGVIHLLKRDINILIAAVIIALLSIQPIGSYYQIKRGDWRGVGRYLVENAGPGDVVVVENGHNKILLNYYLGAEDKGVILKTAAEGLMSEIVPFRIYFHQADYVTPEGRANPEDLSMIDYETIVSFDPDAEISPMYLFVSQPVWFWQEGGRNFFDNKGWNVSDFWGQKIIATDALSSPGAVISYKIKIVTDGSYNFYAKLRWDGGRGLLKYKIDNGKWSTGFQPFYGEKGDVIHKIKFKERKLGTHYLKAGEHIIIFLNQKTSDGIGRYQDIDYFYLTLND